MFKNTLLSLALLLPLSGQAQNLTPILMANGEQYMVCDGQMRFMYTTDLKDKTIAGSYLFANLNSSNRGGADLVIWSPTYGGWGSIADLHIFNQVPVGTRQGERERWFPSGAGIRVNGIVQVAAICWGGGTLEIYAVIWVHG